MAVPSERRSEEILTCHAMYKIGDLERHRALRHLREALVVVAVLAGRAADDHLDHDRRERPAVVVARAKQLPVAALGVPRARHLG